jgi:glycosyltransferase involved in cell wall biosynthesis
VALQQSSITVGLPVYNAMPFLPEAMEGLLRQTVSDFNILAIVDGADDGSLQYLETIRDQRLRVLSQPNRGLTATLNRMLQEVSTGWLIRQDADDISYPTRVERIQEQISKHPDAAMFYSLAEYYPPEHSVGLYRCSRGTPRELRRIVQSGYLLSICHPSVALNVEKTLAVGGYRNIQHSEDADLWWRLALSYDIYLLPEILIGFRQNVSSISSRYSTAQELHGLYIQYLLLSHLSGREPLPLADVTPMLESYISVDRVEAKQQLRFLNMHLAAKRYGSAFASLARSLFASPSYLIQRMIDELFPLNSIANGVSPDLFYRRKEVFWP